jgi:hypothetical protein
MFPDDTSGLLDGLGIDPTDFEWHDLAACKGYPWKDRDPFFEEYEKNNVVAKQIDDLCASCPVTKECFFFGNKTKSTGVFGGFYMQNGEVVGNKNAHKSQEIAKTLAERIYGD